MLGLALREEFQSKRLKGTAIELSNDTNTGATQVAAQKFLSITYPTHDLLKGIEATGPNHGRPVVVIGERGLGKPTPQLLIDVFNIFRENKNRQTVIPSFWLFCFFQGSPRVSLPRFGESNHPKCLGDLIPAANNIANLFGKLLLICAIDKEFIVPCACHKFCARVFLFSEDKPGSILMNVKAVLDNRSEFCLEGVVVNRFITGDINL